MNDSIKPNAAAPIAKPQRMRRGIKAVLFCSLAINLLVAGLVAGAVLSHGGDRDRRPPRLDRISGPMTRALGPEDKRVIGKAMRAAYREMRPSPEDARADYDQVVAALRAEPFDAETVRDAMERQLEIVGKRGKLGQDLLLERLSAMSRAERAEFADRLKEALEKPLGKAGKRLILHD